MLYVSKPCLVLRPRFLFFPSFDGTTYTKTPDSTYSHRSTYGLGNYRGNTAFTTGCKGGSPSNCYLKTEKLDMTTLTWSTVDDYPYTTE